MNLPNKLTILRILMIPLFLLFFFVDTLPHNELWALVIFALAALTDLIDGKIARKQGLITDFGKLMDPLADKLLVMAAMLCFVAIDWVHAAAVVLILSREFLVTSIRLLAAGKGQVLAADMWGKMKTVAQMIWLCVGLTGVLFMSMSLSPVGNPAAFSGNLLIITSVFTGIFSFMTWVVVALTVFSGLHYVRQNKALFQDT